MSMLQVCGRRLVRQDVRHGRKRSVVEMRPYLKKKRFVTKRAVPVFSVLLEFPTQWPVGGGWYITGGHTDSNKV